MKIKQENGAIFFRLCSEEEDAEHMNIYPDKNAEDIISLIPVAMEYEKILSVAVLRGNFFHERERVTASIRAEARERNWKKLHPWDAVLIRKIISDKILEGLGLWAIAIMHDPISDCILVIDRYFDGERLVARYENPNYGWHQDVGFAFEL